MAFPTPLDVDRSELYAPGRYLLLGDELLSGFFLEYSL